MGFGGPTMQAPAPPPPPPAPPIMANASVQQAGRRARNAAAAADGAGFNDTLKTSPSGADAPTTTSGKQLLGT